MGPAAFPFSPEIFMGSQILEESHRETRNKPTNYSQRSLSLKGKLRRHMYQIRKNMHILLFFIGKYTRIQWVLNFKPTTSCPTLLLKRKKMLFVKTHISLNAISIKIKFWENDLKLFVNYMGKSLTSQLFKDSNMDINY